MGLRYTPSSAFDTFPRPYGAPSELRNLAERLHAVRADVMKQQQIGLTSLYNAIHDPGSKLPVEELRQLHEELDKAVARAYGWDDLDMSHDFRRVDYLDPKDNLRRTIAEPVRLEILRRLTLLNKERWEQEELERRLTEQRRPAKKKKASAQPQGKLL